MFENKRVVQQHQLWFFAWPHGQVKVPISSNESAPHVLSLCAFDPCPQILPGLVAHNGLTVNIADVVAADKEDFVIDQAQFAMIALVEMAKPGAESPIPFSGISRVSANCPRQNSEKT